MKFITFLVRIATQTRKEQQQGNRTVTEIATEQQPMKFITCSIGAVTEITTEQQPHKFNTFSMRTVTDKCNRAATVQIHHFLNENCDRTTQSSNHSQIPIRTVTETATKQQQ